MRLENKVCLITGAGTGIGRAIARKFADEGAEVVAVDIDESGLKETCEDRSNMCSQVADLTCSSDLLKIYVFIKSKFSRLDVIVNNAGMAPVNPLDKVTEEEYCRTFDLNVKAVYELTQLFLPMLKSSRGNIVNIGSAVVARPLANMSMYCASKAALTTMTKVFAKEFAPYVIRANSISVGPVWTSIYEKTTQTESEKQAHIEAVLKGVPLGRFGKVQEIASVAAFIASEENGFMTGADIPVDGGFGI